MRIILASGSKNRQELLKIAGINAEIIDSKFDESTITTTNPQERAVELAVKKAEAVSQKLTTKNALIIGADTIGVFNGEILEKPKFKTNALERLKQLQGNVHTMLTGFAVLNAHDNQIQTGFVETMVFFRTISDEELLNYVNENDVVSYAAGYSPLNTTAITFIEKLVGSLTGFSHGLPLEKIIPILHSRN